jgi:hypothetical protein
VRHCAHALRVHVQRRRKILGERDSEEPPSDSEEEASLSNRVRTDTAPSKSAAPASVSSRKRKAESGDASAEVTEAVTVILTTIDTLYTLKKGGALIAAWDLLQSLLPSLTGPVQSSVRKAQKLGKTLVAWLDCAVNLMKDRGDHVTLDKDYNDKLWIQGLVLKLN